MQSVESIAESLHNHLSQEAGKPDHESQLEEGTKIPSVGIFAAMVSLLMELSLTAEEGNLSRPVVLLVLANVDLAHEERLAFHAISTGAATAPLLAKLRLLTLAREAMLVVEGDDQEQLTLRGLAYEHVVTDEEVPRDNLLRFIVDGPGSFRLASVNGVISAVVRGRIAEQRPLLLFKKHIVGLVQGLDRLRANIARPGRRSFLYSDPEHMVDALLHALAEAIREREHGGLLLFGSSASNNALADAKALSPGVRLGDLSRARALARADDFSHRFLVARADGSASPADNTSVALRRQVTVEQGRLDAAVKFVAALCGVDGAVVLDDEFVATHYGAKVALQLDGVTPVRLVFKGEEVEGEHFQMSQHGTRHRAAIAFAAADPSNLALACSHDGHVNLVFKHEDKIVFAAVLVPY